MNVDLVINGGGMVGAALALALGRQGMQVVLIEQQAPRLPAQLDPRVSAISEGAVRYLESLGVALPAAHCQPYQHLAVYEGAQQCLFSSDEIGCEQLGVFIENTRLQQAIWDALPAAVTVKLARASTFTHHSDGVSLTLDNGDAIHARLAIAADGANSWLRDQAGIGLTGWDYRQRCLLVAVKTQGQMSDTTWQQFTPTGPKAWLPMVDNQAVLAWYDSPGEIKRLAALSPAQLAEEAKKVYPAQLGEIEVLSAGNFALTRRHAQRYGQNGVWLVGDAAHTINPLAGQGVNLGFRDVEVLGRLIGAAFTQGEPWWSDSQLKAYERARKPHNLLMQTMMDACYKGFSNDKPLLGKLRGLAVMGLDFLPPLKKQILRYAAGLS
ncbi:FAD-dependent monooxygenase [Gallaecimonas pentaromativorans]|uniref:2-octaprenyl-3-methyl-6-methoxy-1,4-benzoquinol hydroxylase n=1 Tax=Gallaecimonas pentaromativorans TaxID=584787 RepID=A0A3N1P1K7_9GAMM|nr:FAD-dependent monooxygenase [Gallaecimonas pentaromativorans]ROQ25984.1 2-octaprenyl-3-methyl-6-methoxy-1,4-benzoquinol hydroxylase [Gallaecimonas pentaromativorans]